MGINYDAALPAVAYPVGRSSINISDWMQSVKGNLAYLIRQAFRGGEVGFAYDPNDLTTLYQDAAGTTPVTGAGQPVGLVLDKSKGLVLGGELVVNGGFDTDTAWTKNTGVTISGGIVNINTAATAYAIVQSPSVPANRFYKVTYTVSSYTSGGIRCVVGGTAGLIRNQVGTYTEYVISVGSSTIQLASSGGFVGSVDNFTIKELAGNHAYQTTSASRPILRRNATTGAYYLEFDGTDDFLVTNSIDFTATDEITVIAALSKTATPNRFYSIFELSAAASKYDSTAGSFNLAVFNTSLDGFIYRSHGSVLTNDTAAKITTGYAANIPAVLTCKSKIGTDLSSIYEAIGKVSATASLDQGLGNYANRPLYIGRQGGVGTTAFPGHIYSLIGIGRLTTDSETIALEKSIAKNVGVTL